MEEGQPVQAERKSLFWNVETSKGACPLAKAEWEPLFEKQRRKAAALQADILRTDREIDQLVYGLTEEEVGIIEGSS